jgi:hypothetical protein
MEGYKMPRKIPLAGGFWQVFYPLVATTRYNVLVAILLLGGFSGKNYHQDRCELE